MTSSLLTRVVKLESRRGTEDRVLLLWLRPGENVEKATLAAKNAGVFSPGDMVVVVEWLDDDPMPKPQWLKRDDAHYLLFSEKENHCITAMLKKRIAMVDELVAADEPAEVAGLARPMPRDLRELSSVELLHIALGVKT